MLEQHRPLMRWWLGGIPIISVSHPEHVEGPNGMPTGKSSPQLSTSAFWKDSSIFSLRNPKFWWRNWKRKQAKKVLNL
ncbi:hypothetical protein C0J52_25189 [Blattella germanica]|nr:hypothetical protein C0J52_25189 [Blattella germanica]